MHLVQKEEDDDDKLRKINNKINEIDNSSKTAKDKCKLPVKLTWEGLKFSVLINQPSKI